MRLQPFAGHQGARRGLIAALALAALAAAGCQQHSEETGPPASSASTPQTSETSCKSGAPEKTARAFYTAIIPDNDSGLPSAASMPALGPLMTSALRAAVEKARARQGAFIAAHPNEKPPYIEGSLFTSMFEGPTAVESADATRNGDSATVGMGFAYVEEGAETFRWKDQALMRCEEGSWRLDDVRYGGDWDFASKGQLKQALESE
ncbi:MAG: hypothetical protein ACREO0_12340 [Pseudoxanthomonas sp.]